MRLLALFLALLLAGCAGSAPAGDPSPAAPPPLLLISVDGFLPRYQDAVETPALDRIAAAGLRAEYLEPVFPTLTFPNHYSIVTGLHPARHGIVSNTMFDPQFAAEGAPASFSLGNRAAVEDARWWGGEPIWVTAERQGLRAHTLFWPGSEAAIGGVRPTRWLPYDDNLPHDARVDSVLAWLDLPPARRPHFLTLYFSHVDTQGHRYGPDAPEVAEAVREVDRALGRLLDGLEARGLWGRINVLVTSDHGMAELSPERVVILDDHISLTDDVERVTWSSAVPGLWVRPGREEAVLAALRGVPGLTAYRADETPARWHFRGHRRIAPVVLVADEGWTITSRENAARQGERLGRGGAHGYDNALPSMRAHLLAAGPAFRTGTTGPVRVVDLYEAMAAALGLTPAPNDGDPARARQLLR
ncbi:MAG: ectonucleotide pyrophosphatase/phosphodiesterase [Rubricoccaceae bacterium]